MKPCATPCTWKELEESREVWNRAEETKSSRCLWRTSSDDCSRFSLVIQHTQPCKPRTVSDHAHPYEVFGYDMMKGKASAVSKSVRNPTRAHVHQDPLITKSGQKADKLRRGGTGLRRKDQKVFFQTSNLFFIPIMNENWSWLLFYWLKKGMMGETHSGKDVRLLQRCSHMIDSYHWDSEG